MTTFLVTGYKAMDLGVFSDKDPKVTLIKKAIRKDLMALFEDGVDWLVFQGNLGFEAWCLDVALSLQADYGISLACILPFADYGQQWSESNQAVLARFRQLDYVNHSFSSYQSPQQLRQHQDFLLKNTQGIYLFYDEEHPTKLSYLHRAVREKEDYEIRRLTFDRLNELAQDIGED